MNRKTVVLILAGLLGSALAQDRVMEVRVKTIKNGVELDASSGPKRFLCVADQVTHELAISGRKLMTKGKFLTVTFDLVDNHLSMEAHDKIWPLKSNQVRLTCVKDQIQSQVGRDIEVTDSE
ncbi:hypothetical protein FNU79_12765 [Deinococcus detaillensis]|uniref:Uncharacterized protein n=1 Tax=Deinococcus detaillensis TaxID=2592048 RepID=A0A553URZ7_9DEIO|nr:hypothetical protein [Deinococcus detaillensis]TSA82988.1 hypothetical protein FNU79_12765 [Deinococcus detaillensis]